MNITNPKIPDIFAIKVTTNTTAIKYNNILDIGKITLIIENLIPVIIDPIPKLKISPGDIILIVNFLLY
jgi:hypothetical protein